MAPHTESIPADADVSDDYAEIELAIEGMTCASCAGRVQRGLSKHEGVADARVNLASRHATVAYDPER